jgi:hypothetical protein
MPIDPANAIFNNNAVAADNVVFSDYTSHSFTRGIYVMFYNLSGCTPTAPTGTNLAGFGAIFAAESALGNTSSTAIYQGTLATPGAYGVGTIASASTVDAISIGAVFGVGSDDDTGHGWSGTSYGVSQGPGGRGLRDDHTTLIRNKT